MGYMRGDYYTRGDYMGRGDPGFFGDLFRGITHVVGGALGGVLTGGPIGGIIGAVKGAVSGTHANIDAGVREAAVNDSSGGTNPGNLPVLRSPGALITPPPGGMGSDIIRMSPLGTPVSPAAIARQMAGRGGGVRRHYPNKSTYVTRGGGTSRWPVGLQVHPKGTEAVPSRRMNVANPRALRRSLRRVAGFAKLTKRVRRAVSMAASAVGVHRRASKKKR
jgi:hypothetical protein